MTEGDELIGRTLGHFRVLSLLGRGGMGRVYRGEDLDLYRPVALKVLPPEWEAHEDRRARFLREARSAAAVAHANIATIYEVGIAGTTVFIAMELVRGMTLREALGRGLERDRALSIGVGIARGLARAHEVGVLHRDLKPENVMLDRDGEPKILDFGLARALHDAPEAVMAVSAGGSQPDALVSMAGSIVGTPGYLSPEQARGTTVDARSDVFALGILIFELLTGRLPFGGVTPLEQLAAVLHDDPAPLSPDGAPEPIAALVARCLARDPADRFADAGDLRDALVAARDATPHARGAASATSSAVIESAPTMFVPSGSTIGDDDGPFVGRDGDVSEVIRLFDAGQRFITLVGPGGIGKSRMARVIARRLLARERRPVAVASLGAVRTLADALAVSAAALGAELSPGADSVAALGLSLRSHGRVLFLLDEAEGVAPLLGGPLAACLAAAPEAIVLCTSRERLGGTGEHVMEVGPLDVEAGAELFVERARAARAGLRDDDEMRAVAGEIATRLDGSPLAIGLAAARAAILTPAAIRDRLDDRLRLLASRERTDRHGSLRAVLEWSWSLLDEAERAAIGQMSVFRGGAGVDAIDAVVVVAGSYALDVLDALRAKSLIRVADDPVNGTRFVMDESVRLYAEESLREHPAGWSSTCARHAAHYARAASDAIAISEAGVESRGDEWLDAEHDNLLAAADRAIAGEGPTLDDGARAVAALGRSRGEHGVAGAAHERVAALLEHVDELDDVVAVDLLATDVGFEVDRGVASISERAEEAVALAERSGDPERIARARSALCVALVSTGEHGRGAEVAEMALAEAQAAGAPARVERARIDLARARWRGQRAADARAAIEPAIESARARGAQRILPEMLVLLGSSLGALDDQALAAVVETEALAAARAAGLDRVLSAALFNLAVTLQILGRRDEALALHDEVIEHFERRGQTVPLAKAHANVGYIEHQAGALALARSHYQRAAALLLPTGEREWRVFVLGFDAAALAETAAIDQAARQLDAADLIAAELEPSVTRDVLAVLRGHLEVARAKTAQPEARADLLAAAHARIAHVSTPDTTGTTPRSRSEAIRSAVQSLERALSGT